MLGLGIPEIAARHRGVAAVALPALPLAAGARLADFGHSFVLNGAQQTYNAARTETGGHTGFTECSRGLLKWVKALDGRFNGDVFAEFAHPFFAPSSFAAFSGASQGKGGDCLRPGADQVPPVGGTSIPGSIPRTPYLAGQGPGIVNLQMGTNDVTRGRSVEQLVSDYNLQVQMLTNAGIWVVLNTIAWNSAMIPGSDALAKAQALNSWIIAQAGRDGVKILDTLAFDGPESGISPSLFYDGTTHPSDWLARVKARDHLLPLLQTMVAAGETRDLDPLSGNLFPAAGLPGTGGSKSSSGGGTAMGNVATGISVTKANNASSILCSKEAVSAGVEKQVIGITGAADASAVHSLTVRTSAALTLAGAGLAVGDWLEFIVPFECSDWAGFDVTSATPSATSAAHMLLSAGSSSAELFAVGSNVSGRNFSTVARVVMPLPAAITAIDRLRLNSAMITVRWLGGAAGSGTIKIGSPILRKLAANPRTAWGLG
jgi:hypothetical protein